MREIKEIILHCSATPAGREHDVLDITRWHLKRGFNGVGYHYVIKLDGSVQIGRPLEEVGAHCSGHNMNSIGICYIGGLSRDGKRVEDTRTPEQKAALELLLRQLHREYPKATLHGHREFAPKSCPCFNVREYNYIFG